MILPYWVCDTEEIEHFVARSAGASIYSWTTTSSHCLPSNNHNHPLHPPLHLPLLPIKKRPKIGQTGLRTEFEDLFPILPSPHAVMTRISACYFGFWYTILLKFQPTLLQGMLGILYRYDLCKTGLIMSLAFITLRNLTTLIIQV
jgi:hypothetical protein